MVPSDDLAELARRVRQEAEGTPEREEFLRRLTEKLRSGQYQVDADALARKLLDKIGPSELDR